MKLSICLITRGRKKFLQDILKSLEIALSYDDVEVIIVNNGCDKEVSTILSAWHVKFSESTHLIHHEFNEFDMNKAWQEIRQRNVKWVVFPGDDDIFEPQIIDIWRSHLVENSDIVGFASSIQLIDENGTIIRDCNLPSVHGESLSETLAHALHEPPYWWPAFFFRFDKIPTNIPSTAFVLDWWSQLYLLCVGRILTTDAIGVKYRIHNQQTGFLGNNQRKYLEAELWLGRLISQPMFGQRVFQLPDSELGHFLECVFKRPPIYGDVTASRSILIILLNYILESQRSHSLKSWLVNNFAFYSGVILKKGEGHSLIWSSSAVKEFPANFSLIAESGVCDSLKELCREFPEVKNAQRMRISCLHSKRRRLLSLKHSHYVNCTRLATLDKAIRVDYLVVVLSSLLERNGSIRSKLTPGELVLLRTLRKYYNLLPWNVKNRFKSWKDKSND